MEGSNTVEALWARALELSEDGSVHEAVLTFEQAAQLLEKQKDQAMKTKGAERVRQQLPNDLRAQTRPDALQTAQRDLDKIAAMLKS